MRMILLVAGTLMTLTTQVDAGELTREKAETCARSAWALPEDPTMGVIVSTMNQCAEQIVGRKLTPAEYAVLNKAFADLAPKEENYVPAKELTAGQITQCAAESVKPWAAGYAAVDTPAPLTLLFACAKRVAGRNRLSNAEMQTLWSSGIFALTHTKCGMADPGKCPLTMGSQLAR